MDFRAEQQCPQKSARSAGRHQAWVFPHFCMPRVPSGSRATALRQASQTAIIWRKEYTHAGLLMLPTATGLISLGGYVAWLRSEISKEHELRISEVAKARELRLSEVAKARELRMFDIGTAKAEQAQAVLRAEKEVADKFMMLGFTEEYQPMQQRLTLRPKATEKQETI